MKHQIITANKPAKKKKKNPFSEWFVLYKITFNDVGGKEEVHGTTVARKALYGSEPIVSPQHLVWHSSQLGETRLRSGRGTRGVACPNQGKPGQSELRRAMPSRILSWKPPSTESPPFCWATCVQLTRRNKGWGRKEGKDNRKEERGNEKESK